MKANVVGIFSFFSRAMNRPSGPGSSRATPPLPVVPTFLEHGSITIFAADQRISDFVPASGVPVCAIPYIVGRSPELHDDVSRQPTGLLLRDDKPYRLSRRHFAIIRREAQYWVVDGSSHLGTVVNGRRIGRKHGCDGAALHVGANEVVAGGAGSEFAFRIVVG